MKNLVFFLISTGLFLPLISNADEPRVIQVSAFAEKAITPDMVYVNVEIWSKSSTAEKTQAMAAQKTKQARAVFKQFKIKEEDIQTQSYNFSPEQVWDNKKNENKMVGFRSSQNFRVTLREADQLGALVDNLTRPTEKIGNPSEVGTNVGSLTWDSSKRDEVELATLTEAVKISRRRADEIARASQVKIKGVYQMGHRMGGNEAQPISFGKSELMRGGVAAMADAPPTEMSSGQIKVVVAVSAAYEIQ
ncbi:MAG: SIMPL domain-containing protein [Bdellovibrionota bacterium]